MDAEGLVEIRAGAFDLGKILVINDNRERISSEVVPIDFQFLKGFSQVSNLSFFRLVDQDVVAALGLIGSGEVT